MKRLLAAVISCVALLAYAQHDHHQSVPQVQAPDPQQELNQIEDAMSRHSHGDHDHHMGPHMKMSALRPEQSGDQEKAAKIVQATRAAIERYRDPAAAEADGFKMFLPQVKHQKQYHYTNYENAFTAAFDFDPTKPTSLLYADDKDGKKQLIGVMFTAPARFTEDQLADRIPMSVAQWHQHVNLCIPPKDQRGEMFDSNPRFGLLGSISTEGECKAAGGTFRPRIFGWMVHMYPYEKTPDEIWSVERQRVENLRPDPMTAGSEHQHP
jgi:hypothetical protein